MKTLTKTWGKTYDSEPAGTNDTYAVIYGKNNRRIARCKMEFDLASGEYRAEYTAPEYTLIERVDYVHPRGRVAGEGTNVLQKGDTMMLSVKLVMKESA